MINSFKAVALASMVMLGTSSVHADTYTTYNGVAVGTEQDQSDVTIGDIMKSLDLDHVFDSMEVRWWKWDTCEGSLYHTPGFEMCYDEPFIIGDYSMTAGRLSSLGITLQNDFSKNGYLRQSDEASMHGFGWANLIFFPLLGLVIDVNEFCFEEGDLSLPYLSIFDPTYDGIFAGDVFAEIGNMFNTNAMLLGAIDCAASSTEFLNNFNEDVEKYNIMTRMAMPHYIGCWNTFPMGGWAHNPDPILQAATGNWYGLAMLSRAGTVRKTMILPGLEGSLFPDTRCGPKAVPEPIKVQWRMNLAYPTASEMVPLGAIATEWAEFKNKPESVDDAVFWIAQRKCILFGAAPCGEK